MGIIQYKIIFDSTKNKKFSIFTAENLPIKYYHNSDLDKDLIIKENWRPGVFMWTNKKTGHRYVGSSVLMSKYLYEFYSYKPKAVYKTSKVWIDICLYGHSEFSLSILMYIDRGNENNDELLKRTLLEKNKFIKLIKPEYNRFKGK